MEVEIPGSQVESIEQSPNVVRASSCIRPNACPTCGCPSHCIHSNYMRQLSAESRLQLQVRVKRFRYLNAACQRQQTFAESLQQLTCRYARRTTRLAKVIEHIGQIVGGQAGSRLTNHLKIPASRYSIIRLLRRMHCSVIPKTVFLQLNRIGKM